MLRQGSLAGSTGLRAESLETSLFDYSPRVEHAGRRPLLWATFVLSLVIFQTGAARAATHEEVNSVGVLMPYLSPEEPLQDGAGLMFRYSRTLGETTSQSSDKALDSR